MVGKRKNIGTEVKAYEEQIRNLEIKLVNSKKIVSEQQEKIQNAKKELLVLWKMEINAAVSKKQENLGLPMPLLGSRQDKIAKSQNAFKKLKKVSKRKTCMYLKTKDMKTPFNSYK